MGARQDEAEFTALVERRSRFVFRVAYAVLRNAYDAEDIVQETFLKLYRTKAWQEMRDEQAFLARAAWRLAVDRLPTRIHEEADDFELFSKGSSPEQQAIALDWQERVHRLIDALPEELRQPLALSSIDEMTSSEIAAVMAIPEGTVRTRLMRARQMLREKMASLEGARHVARRL